MFVRLFTLSLTLALGACSTSPPASAGSSGASAPAIDEAPGDLPPSGVRPLMWRLANNVRALYAGFNEEKPELQPSQKSVVERLAAMRGVAVDLSLVPERRNHSVLDEGVLGFAADLEAAWKAAQETPPNYTLAKNVTGACTNCHSLRPCPFDRYEQCINAPIY